MPAQSRSALDDLADPTATGFAADDTAADGTTYPEEQEEDLVVGHEEEEPALEEAHGGGGGDDDSHGPETPAQFVTRTITENRVVVFSKSYCPYRCAPGWKHSRRGRSGLVVFAVLFKRLLLPGLVALLRFINRRCPPSALHHPLHFLTLRHASPPARRAQHARQGRHAAAPGRGRRGGGGAG